MSDNVAEVQPNFAQRCQRALSRLQSLGQRTQTREDVFRAWKTAEANAGKPGQAEISKEAHVAWALWSDQSEKN